MYKPLTGYTTENGLSLNSVNDLLFDRNGFLWIATADGLQRFDGYDFLTFKNDPADKTSLAENYVGKLYEDNDGNLWITTRNGISLKRKQHFEFIDFSTRLPMNDSKFQVCCVKETDSSVWVLNYPYGLYSINKHSLKADKITSFGTTGNTEHIWQLSSLNHRNKQVWIRKGSGYDGDIYFITNKGIQVFHNEKKVKQFFLLPVKEDSLVMITDNMIYKASVKDPFLPARILQQPFDASMLDNPYTVPKMIGDHEWLLQGSGQMLVYDEIKEAVTASPYNEFFTGNANRYLYNSMNDDNGNTWMGYNGIGGIKVFSPQKFDIFKRPDKEALPYCLGTDSASNVYVGIYLGDIEVYNSTGKFIKKIVLPGADKKFGSARGMAMIDRSTLIVKSTWDELYSIDVNTGALTRLHHLLPLKTDSAVADFELCMQKTGDNEVWFSYRNAILSLQKKNDQYSCHNICTIPSARRINSFLKIPAGDTWIGTTSGMWKFGKNGFQHIASANEYIKNINQYGNRIWAATTNGILIIENEKIVRRLGAKDGLPNSFVYAVLFDEKGNAWASTNKGLARITPGNQPGDTAWKVTSYTDKEGLQGEEFNTDGFCKTADGTLYFAGVNGINFFKPNDIIRNKLAAQTMLTGIEINGMPWLPKLQPEFINTINLSYQQNNIRLSFSCMDLTVPAKNQYKFLLKGFQDEWSKPQTNNSIQYILPPGDYKLYVLGSNYEGTWNKEPLLIYINISPPWYQALWARTIFILLALIAAGLVFYFISRSRYQKKLRQLQLQRDVQKEKERLSRDLHDNLGSQLTWLSNNISQLENLVEQQQSPQQKLSSLKEGAGELMQTLRETIWILNKDKISCAELCDKVVSFAVRHIESCPGIKLEIEEDLSSEIILSSTQALQVFRICQEAINNSCKHAAATQLSIAVHANNERFTISIGDNGKGFELGSGERTDHYGLQNMKQRAEEANLIFTINSSISKGTVITLSV
ncbi:MAG: two-component regulator propeller domain-containing protein [Ferruginibacter sp.]